MIDLQKKSWTRAGVEIVLRPIRKEDEQLLGSFAEYLSPEALYHRFFRHIQPSRDLLHRLADIDETKQAAILALIKKQDREEIAGVGRCFMEQQEASGEIIITVRDDYHNKGVGKEILASLIALARKRGLKRLTAQVLADNVAMLRLIRSFEGTEYEIQRRINGGVFHFEMVLK